MTSRSANRSNGRVRRLRRRWLPARADESGITTLEWLLIVAAVAGLAALAVVLVQNVVSDTSEQIAGSSARRTAAEIAAAAIVQESKNPGDLINDDRWNTWGKWQQYFTTKCQRLGITYADAGVTIYAKFVKHRRGNLDGTPTQIRLDQANEAVIGPWKPRVVCKVTG